VIAVTRQLGHHPVVDAQLDKETGDLLFQFTDESERAWPNIIAQIGHPTRFNAFSRI